MPKCQAQTYFPLNQHITQEPSTAIQLQQYPIEKNSICWLGMFWSMAAGLSWLKAGYELV